MHKLEYPMFENVKKEFIQLILQKQIYIYIVNMHTHTNTHTQAQAHRTGMPKV